MKVSVIIPTYNRAHFICQAIESVLQQTMQDIEIIVVDDGSTDNTADILKPYDDIIAYIKTDNRGPAHARNTGMKRARGEYIAFLDSDDLYYPYKTELQVRFLDRYPDVAMVCSDFSAFNADGYWDEYHLKHFHNAYQDDNLTYEDIFSEHVAFAEAGLPDMNFPHKKIYMGHIYHIYLDKLVIGTPTIMFRREILDSVGFQDESLWIFEEYDFVLRISKFHKVAFLAVPTYKYRYHENQISISQQKQNKIKIVVMKQTYMLAIARKHCLNDRDYYLQNQEKVNRRIAVLNKALAIPLMVKGNNNKKARMLLKECDLLNHPEYLLWLTTFAPYIIRRIIIKIYSLATQP